jgi:hypothetical protein
MATISISIVDATASINITHTLAISDADAATILSAYAVQYPGTTAQTILGWCTKVFSDMLSVGTGYKQQQAVAAVIGISNTIT